MINHGEILQVACQGITLPRLLESCDWSLTGSHFSKINGIKLDIK